MQAQRGGDCDNKDSACIWIPLTSDTLLMKLEWRMRLQSMLGALAVHFATLRTLPDCLRSSSNDMIGFRFCRSAQEREL